MRTNHPSASTLATSERHRRRPYRLFAVAAAVCAASVVGCDRGAPSAAADDVAERHGAVEGRWVRFEHLSGASDGPWVSLAEFEVLDDAGRPLPRDGWTVRASSQDVVDLAVNAVDGLPATIWHSRWQGDRPAQPPHELVIDLGRSQRVGGFRYLPRQDGSSNGITAGFRFYVAPTDGPWPAPVLDGDLTSLASGADARIARLGPGGANRAPEVRPAESVKLTVGVPVDLQIVAKDPDGDLMRYSARSLPTGISIDARTGRISGTPRSDGEFVSHVIVADGRGQQAMTELRFGVQLRDAPDRPVVRYVRLEVLDDPGGGPWTSIAELNVLDGDGQSLPRTGWVVEADSASPTDPPGNAIDGRPETIWHSDWTAAVSPPHPHHLSIDLGRPIPIGGIRVLPRQDRSDNGHVGRFRLLGSTVAGDWSRVLAEGDFRGYGPARAEKTLRLDKTSDPAGPAADALTLTVGSREISSPLGRPLRVTVARAPDGAAVVYSAVGLPPGLSIDGLTGEVSGTPTLVGSFAPRVAASDTSGRSSGVELRWRISSTAGGQHRARYFRLEQLSEASGRQSGSIAEIDLIGADGAPLPRSGWIASANSSAEDHLPSAAIDGIRHTFWHTRAVGVPAPLPHQMTIDLGRLVSLRGFRYLPRQDASDSGLIARYRAFVSEDGIRWSDPVSTGDLAAPGSDRQARTVMFE